MAEDLKWRLDYLRGRSRPTSSHGNSQAFRQFKYLTSPLEGARTDAPGAIEVADRWHLLPNLTSAVDRGVHSHQSYLKEPIPDADQLRPTIVAVTPPPVHPAEPDGPRHQTLNPDVKTVRRYVRASTPEKLLTKNPGRRGRQSHSSCVSVDALAQPLIPALGEEG